MHHRILLAAAAALLATIPASAAPPGLDAGAAEAGGTPDPGLHGVVPPGANPCDEPDYPYCAPRVLNSAGCHATGILISRPVPAAISNVRVTSVPRGPPAVRDAHQATVNFVAGTAQAVNAHCNVWAGFPPLPTGCAEADVADLRINVGPTLLVRAEFVKNRVCHTLAEVGFQQEGSLVSGSVSVLGQTKIFAHGTQPNQRVVLPGVGFVVFNERSGGFMGDCFVRNGAGMRIVLFAPATEVLVSWVSVSTCKVVPRMALRSFPALSDGTFPPGTSVSARLTVSHPFASTPLPSGGALFFLCDPDLVIANGGSCAASGLVLAGGQLQGIPPTAFSDATSHTNKAGFYCWRGVYEGNSVFVGPWSVTGSLNECFVVQGS